jgi:hypothetical protein
MGNKQLDRDKIIEFIRTYGHNKALLDLDGKITSGAFNVDQEAQSHQVNSSSTLHFQKFSKGTMPEVMQSIILIQKHSNVGRITRIGHIVEYGEGSNPLFCNEADHEAIYIDDPYNYRWAYIDHLWEAFDEKDTVPVDMAKDGSADKQYSVDIEEHPSFPKFDEKVHVLDTGEIEKRMNSLESTLSNLGNFVKKLSKISDTICDVLGIKIVENWSGGKDPVTLDMDEAKVGDEKENDPLQEYNFNHVDPEILSQISQAIDDAKSKMMENLFKICTHPTIVEDKTYPTSQPDLNKVFYEAEDVEGFRKTVLFYAQYPAIMYVCDNCFECIYEKDAKFHNCKDKK